MELEWYLAPHMQKMLALVSRGLSCISNKNLTMFLVECST